MSPRGHLRTSSGPPAPPPRDATPAPGERDRGHDPDVADGGFGDSGGRCVYEECVALEARAARALAPCGAGCVLRTGCGVRAGRSSARVRRSRGFAGPVLGFAGAPGASAGLGGVRPHRAAVSVSWRPRRRSRRPTGPAAVPADRAGNPPRNGQAGTADPHGVPETRSRFTGWPPESYTRGKAVKEEGPAVVLPEKPAHGDRGLRGRAPPSRSGRAVGRPECRRA